MAVYRIFIDNFWKWLRKNRILFFSISLAILIATISFFRAKNGMKGNRIKIQFHVVQSDLNGQFTNEEFKDRIQKLVRISQYYVDDIGLDSLIPIHRYSIRFLPDYETLNEVRSNHNSLAPQYDKKSKGVINVFFHNLESSSTDDLYTKNITINKNNQFVPSTLIHEILHLFNYPENLHYPGYATSCAANSAELQNDCYNLMFNTKTVLGFGVTPNQISDIKRKQTLDNDSNFQTCKQLFSSPYYPNFQYMQKAFPCCLDQDENEVCDESYLKFVGLNHKECSSQIRKRKEFTRFGFCPLKMADQDLIDSINVITSPDILFNVSGNLDTLTGIEPLNNRILFTTIKSEFNEVQAIISLHDSLVKKQFFVMAGYYASITSYEVDELFDDYYGDFQYNQLKFLAQNRPYIFKKYFWNIQRSIADSRSAKNNQGTIIIDKDLQTYLGLQYYPDTLISLGAETIDFHRIQYNSQYRTLHLDEEKITHLFSLL